MITSRYLSRLLAVAAGIAAAGFDVAAVAQTPAPAPAMDHSKMDHSKMDHSKMDHSKMGHSMPGAAAAGETAATKAFKAANDKMHAGMAIPFTGNADEDFIKGMLPHHQGAVDMAKIVLQYGKDPAVRKLAEEIIAAQDTEITLMKAWLAKNGK
jgi:uncharacterized protein (DUF305 family)